MPNEVRLTRKELYRLVWSESMLSLAKKFNLSDVGFAKICKKHHIPRPGPGYWAKLQAGKDIEEIPLPDADKNPEIIIDTSGKYRIMQNRHAYSAEKLRKMSILFSVPDILKNPHLLVQQTKKILLEHPDTYYTKLEVLNINVRNSNLSRSLRIMDTIIKIMESRGYRVVIEHDGPREYGTVVYVKGARIEIRLYENGGILTFGLASYIDGRKNWGDGKKNKLENKLYDIVLRILLIAREQLHWSIERRIRAKKQKELDWMQAEEERLQREEEERIQNLEIQVENWRKSCHIREYLKAAVDFVNQKRGGYTEGSEFDLWLKWAHAYADRITPLRLS